MEMIYILWVFRMKDRKYMKFMLFCTALWLVLLICLFSIPFPFVSGHYSPTCILVTEQVNGPNARVLKGAKELRNAIPVPHPEDLNTDEIEMVGNSIYESLKDAFYFRFSYVITGKYIELTTRYQNAGFGTIPVFQVDTVTPVGPLESWLQVKFGTANIYFLCIIFWIFPFWVVYLCFLLLRKDKKI